MSYIAYSSTRHLLISDSTITSYVPAAYIRIGYETDTLYTPSITIHQAGGNSWGYLGYGTSSEGSRIRGEDNTMQIDIFHTWTVLSSQRIGDAIEKALTYNGWYRKLNDNDKYLNELECYNKTQVWNYRQNVED